MHHSQRRFLVVLTALALASSLVQAITGIEELVLHLTPLFLVVALLLSGHYVGQERLIAALQAYRAPAQRPLPARRPVRRERSLASSLERTPRSPRGPPVLRSHAV